MASAEQLMSVGLSAAKAQLLQRPLSTNDVHDSAPTIAQLTAAFGAPTVVGANFMGVINDAGGGTNFYLVCSDGTNWFFTKMTKAS